LEFDLFSFCRVFEFQFFPFAAGRCYQSIDLDSSASVASAHFRFGFGVNKETNLVWTGPDPIASIPGWQGESYWPQGGGDNCKCNQMRLISLLAQW